MSDREDAPLPPHNHNAPSYWREVAYFIADLRAEFSRYSKAKAWAHTADRVNLSGIAQAAMAIRETKPPWEESAADKELRLSAKRFHAQLEAAFARRMKATDGAGPDIRTWIEGEFAPALHIARKFAQPAPMTATWHVADKIIEAIGIANRDCQGAAKGRKRLIPTGLGVDGPVVQLTFMALKNSGALRELESDPDDGEGKKLDVIRKHLEKRLHR
ncbi:hypothetical+protein [Methylocapsa aurea]|uniref:hypothetical protein n=1 Tax=Methylocapsa aurea TaxID=663610 RepID=UPI003D188D34